MPAGRPADREPWIARIQAVSEVLTAYHFRRETRKRVQLPARHADHENESLRVLCAFDSDSQASSRSIFSAVPELLRGV